MSAASAEQDRIAALSVALARALGGDPTVSPYGDYGASGSCPPRGLAAPLSLPLPVPPMPPTSAALPGSAPAPDTAAPAAAVVEHLRARLAAGAVVEPGPPAPSLPTLPVGYVDGVPIDRAAFDQLREAAYRRLGLQAPGTEPTLAHVKCVLLGLPPIDLGGCEATRPDGSRCPRRADRLMALTPAGALTFSAAGVRCCAEHGSDRDCVESTLRRRDAADASEGRVGATGAIDTAVPANGGASGEAAPSAPAPADELKAWEDRILGLPDAQPFDDFPEADALPGLPRWTGTAWVKELGARLDVEPAELYRYATLWARHGPDGLWTHERKVLLDRLALAAAGKTVAERGQQAHADTVYAAFVEAARAERTVFVLLHMRLAERGVPLPTRTVQLAEPDA